MCVSVWSLSTLGFSSSRESVDDALGDLTKMELIESFCRRLVVRASAPIAGTDHRRAARSTPSDWLAVTEKPTSRPGSQHHNSTRSRPPPCPRRHACTDAIDALELLDRSTAMEGCEIMAVPMFTMYVQPLTAPPSPISILLPWG
jgi:hypothetical protein